MNVQSNVLVGSIRKAPWRSASRRLVRLQIGLTLVVLDSLCILAGFGIAMLLYERDANFGATSLSLAILPMYLVAAFGSRSFASDVVISRRAGVLYPARAFIYAATIVLFVAFYLKSSADLSRGIFALGSTGSLALLVIVRIIVLRRISKRFGEPYKTVVINDDEIAASDNVEYSLFGTEFDVHDLSPQMYDRLARALEDADRLVIDCPPEKRGAWIEALRGANIDASMVVRELAELNPIGLDYHRGLPTIAVARGPLNLQNRIVKRSFDVFFAGTAFVLLSPLLVAIAVAIKLESEGDVFFRQTRIGRGNKLFDIYKFRSMRVEQCDSHGSASTARDDDRITRVGAFIRKTSMDELPQLLNILRGEMSIVGPRPHALGSRAESQLFWEIDKRYWNRHSVKPGLTGLAQIRGFRGATSQRSDLISRLHADLEYLDKWSIWRDVGIIARTFNVISHKNAF